ncbi:MAG: hypothetical protein ACREJ3_01110, partial [Polyangiaceae bacterium]
DGASFMNRRRGLRMEADGTLLRVASPAETPGTAAIPPRGRAAAALTTALAGIALPMLLAEWFLDERRARDRGRWVRRIRRPHEGAGTRRVVLSATAIAIAASILLFQAAALNRAPALFATLPWAALLALALSRSREPTG